MPRKSGDAAGPGQPYAGIVSLPCAALGIRFDGEVLIGLDFLPKTTAAQAPGHAVARHVATELAAYLENPRHRFDLPLRLDGTPFRLRVWAALAEIPVGHTLSYGELALRLGTSARAVGQALGDNSLPIVVPCHRVVARAGLGGFDHRAEGFTLGVKQWLLQHERAH